MAGRVKVSIGSISSYVCTKIQIVIRYHKQRGFCVAPRYAPTIPATRYSLLYDGVASYTQIYQQNFIRIHKLQQHAD